MERKAGLFSRRETNSVQNYKLQKNMTRQANDIAAKTPLPPKTICLGKHRSQKILVILLYFISGLSYGGTLGDFEHDSTAPEKKDESHSHDNNTCSTKKCNDHDHTFLDDVFDDLFSDMFNDIFNGTIAFFTYGTQVTLDRTSLAQTMPGITKRKPGSPLLPTFRATGTWQSVYPDVEGRDFSIEAGYSLFSAQYRRTTYIESGTHDELNLSYGVGYYRLSFGNSFEFNLGAGAAELKGNQKTSGSTVVIPILWKPAEHYALSFWQAYTTFNTVPLTDLDLSLMYINRGFSAEFGYRSVSNPASDLSGPYIGISYFY